MQSVNAASRKLAQTVQRNRRMSRFFWAREKMSIGIAARRRTVEAPARETTREARGYTMT